MDTVKNKDLQVNLRGAENVLMITVLEGEGKEIPYQTVNYIITKDGSILGKVDREWLTRGTLDY